MKIETAPSSYRGVEHLVHISDVGADESSNTSVSTAIKAGVISGIVYGSARPSKAFWAGLTVFGLTLLLTT